MKKENAGINNNKYTVADAFICIFFLLIVVIGISFIFEIILSIIARVKGVELGTLLKTDIVQIIQVALSPVVFITFYLVFTKVRKVRFREAWSDGQKISLLPVSIAIVLAIISIFLFTPFMNLLDYFWSRFGYIADNSIPLQDLMSSNGGYFVLGLIVYALLPAIGEELIFRGIILKGMQSRFSGFVAIFFSTLLFVLMHGSLQQTAYQLLVGIMLGYLACVGGSIVYSIILHFLSNALVIVFSCFDIVGYLSGTTIYYNIFSMIFPFCLFLLGVVLVGILFWVLKYLRNKNFFRYDPVKKKKKKVKVELEEKIGIRAMWKNLASNEKLFMLMSIVLIGIVWIINTISGFVAF